MQAETESGLRFILRPPHHEDREINLIRLVDAAKDTIRKIQNEFG
jgi:hypothetical protein